MRIRPPRIDEFRTWFSVKTGPLPLTYAAVEVTLGRSEGNTISIWGYLRIKPEHFDISGGWVNATAGEAYLKALKRLHVNTGHLAITPGYSDTELSAFTHSKWRDLEVCGRRTPANDSPTHELI